MLRQGLIFLSGNELARRIATHAPGARGMARRFVAGESIDDGIAAVRAVNAYGMSASLDYLGEAVRNRSEAEAAADTYINVLDRIDADRLDANVSLKLTQMGQDIDETFLRWNVGRVLDRAREAGIFVRFDMESSDYTERTLSFFRQVWEEGYRNVGVVLQSYMRRSVADARRANAMGARVRLCKGAYREPRTVAFQDKDEVDANFVRLMHLLLEHGTYPAIATHDEAMIAATRSRVEHNGVQRSDFEFQMLYGVRRDLQHRLHAGGYNMRVYIPFGAAWYPYLMRRLAERPANLFFFLGAVIAESPLRFLRRRRATPARSSRDDDA